MQKTPEFGVFPFWGKVMMRRLAAQKQQQIAHLIYWPFHI